MTRSMNWAEPLSVKTSTPASNMTVRNADRGSSSSNSKAHESPKKTFRMMSGSLSLNLMNKPSTFTPATAAASTTAAITTAAAATSTESPKKRSSSPRKQARAAASMLLQHIPKAVRRRFSPNSNKNQNVDLTVTTDNLGEWLSWHCPQDVLPHIVAFAGPQTALSLSVANRHWNELMNDEFLWRVMCEELYKWKEGDEIPDSWKQYYRMNPCVPVDFSCIANALAVVCASETKSNLKDSSDKNQKKRTGRQHRPVHVWLRPGLYTMRKPVHILTSRRSVDVVLEKMEIPVAQRPRRIAGLYNRYWQPREIGDSSYSSGGVAEDQTSSYSALSDYEYDDEYDLADDDDDDDEDIPKNAVVIKLQNCRKLNVPLFRVSRGGLVLRNIRLHHYSMGNDIWGGNAAVHIEPRPEEGEAFDTDNVPKASARLENCEIMSTSGRGIVVMQGGQVNVDQCYVHHCAGTGIYVSGVHSQAHISRSDIIGNGNGNRGLARGHSGLCLEHGQVKLIDTNVSHNTASGVSVIASVGGEHCRLTMMQSDLIGNGMLPLDIPVLPPLAFQGNNGDDDDNNNNAVLWSILQNSRTLGNRLLPYGDIRPRTAMYQNAPPSLLTLAEFDEYLAS